MELKPLTIQEYDAYVEKAIKNYEDELAASGMVPADKAKQEADATFNRILPEGFNTANHHFYYAYDQDIKVGFIWYGFRREAAFIYDFYIEESLRGKGYGKKVMLICEADAKDKGAQLMELHVFGHNKAARALYESLDYFPTSIQMRKIL